MKSFDKLIFIIVLISLILFAALNLGTANIKEKSSDFYKVELNRVKQELAEGEIPDIKKYKYLTDIIKYKGQEDFFSFKSEYAIIESDGELYRVEYKKSQPSDKKLFIYINIIFAAAFAIIFTILVYIRQFIIKPFNKISDMPYRLAKGDFSAEIKENKNRYFGKFIWCIDMLRDELRASDKLRLEKIKHEKTILLSLSHDIKTPLSAIKLYSKAISKGLYQDREKILQTAENIEKKADEIEKYLNEIIHNSSEELFNFKVDICDFYLSEVIEKINLAYKEKLLETGIIFEIHNFNNCMISGDADRLFEVLSNIIENAVKYGDGQSISISFSDEEDCKLITVKNSGCTLSENEFDHIFDSFWRGSNIKNHSGSGLGLFICRKLMKQMGGDIFADANGGYMSVTAVCKKSS